MDKKTAIKKLQELYEKTFKADDTFRYAFTKRKENNNGYVIVVGFLNSGEVRIESNEIFINVFSSFINENQQFTIDDLVKREITDEIEQCGNSSLLIQPSLSIGNYLGENAGTLGTVIKLLDKSLIVSCNHVLRGWVGEGIVSPGIADLNTEDQVTPTLFAQFSYGTYTDFVDAAYAEIEKGQKTTAATCCGETLLYNTLNFAEDEMKIRFCKRLSKTYSEKKKIISTSCIVRAKIRDNRQNHYRDFFNQIVTERNTQRGDSGAVACNSKNFAIGMVFAHSGRLTFLNPIHDVFTLLLYYTKKELLDSGDFTDSDKEIFNWIKLNSYNKLLENGKPNSTINKLLDKISFNNH